MIRVAAGALAFALAFTGQVLRIVKPPAVSGGGGGGGTGVQARLNLDQGGAIGSCAGWPLGNASSEVNAAENGITYLKEQSPRLGPEGQCASRWTWDLRGVGEEAFGWRWLSMPATGTNDYLYLRWKMYLNSPMQTGNFGIKLIIVGDDDPTPDDQRVIVTLRQWSCAPGTDNCYTFDVDRNIDGLNTGIILNDTFDDQWLDVQVEIHKSAAGTGGIKVWLNTDVYASPTKSVTGENFTGAYSGDMKFGYFGDTNEGGAHTVYDITSFEYGTTSDTSGFDSNWTNGGAFWARTLTPADVWRLALRRPVPWRGFSRAERRPTLGA